MINLSRFGDPARSPEDAYLPFLAAIEADRLDPAAVPLHDPHDAALMLRNGDMPSQGAVVDLGRERLGAYDLVAIENLSEREAVLVPSPKHAVDDETGAVRRSGGLILTDEEGVVTLHALFDRPEKALWRPETYRDVGEVSLRWLWPPQKYQIIDIDSGIYIARKPMRPL